MTSAAGCGGPRMCRRLGCSSQAQAFGACRCSISLSARQVAVRGVIGPRSLRQTTVSLVRGTQPIRRLQEIAEPGPRRRQLRAHFQWHPSCLLPRIALPEIDRWMERRERSKVNRRCMQSEKGRSSGEPKETFSPAGIHPYNLGIAAELSPARTGSATSVPAICNSTHSTTSWAAELQFTCSLRLRL